MPTHMPIHAHTSAEGCALVAALIDCRLPFLAGSDSDSSDGGDTGDGGVRGGDAAANVGGWTWINSYGLYSYGLYSYGLYSYGLCSTPPHNRHVRYSVA